MRGSIGLPAAGMQAVGRQLADRLDPERLHLGRRPRRSRRARCAPTAARVRADAVVVATDPATADRLLPGLGAAARGR